MTTNRRRPTASADPEMPVYAAGPVPAAEAPAVPASHRDTRDAVLGYLGVAVAGVLPPLAVYLASRRRSAFARRHAAEALRVSCAAGLYGICALIIGGMLALDSVKVAVLIVGPLALAFWLVLVTYLVRAARAARHGDPPQAFPSWLRVSPRNSAHPHDRG